MSVSFGHLIQFVTELHLQLRRHKLGQEVLHPGVIQQSTETLVHEHHVRPRNNAIQGRQMEGVEEVHDEVTQVHWFWQKRL